MIAQYYNRYAEHKGTQFVFSDLGTYKPDQWNPYSEIKRKLVEDHGIPEDQIRFIQEAKTEKKWWKTTASPKTRYASFRKPRPKRSARR